MPKWQNRCYRASRKLCQITCFLGGTPFDIIIRGEPPHQGHEILSRKTSLCGSHSKDFLILACTVLIQITSVTDRRTDRRPDDGKDARSILLSHVKTIKQIVFLLFLCNVSSSHKPLQWSIVKFLTSKEVAMKICGQIKKYCEQVS